MHKNLKYAVVSTFVSLVFQSSPALASLDNGGAFTPDGKQIIYHSYQDKAGELWMMARDGSNAHKITEGNNHDRWPSVSADGKKILFISRRDKDWEVFTSDINGSNIKQITHNEVTNVGTSWSPDGLKIVYAQSQVKGNNMDIYLTDREGNEHVKLIENAVAPKWSADGEEILFTRFGDKNAGIYKYNFKSKNIDKLIGAEGTPSSANWSGDGRYIYFVAMVEGERKVHRMKADGSHLENLNLSAQMDSSPQLSADGKQLIWGLNRHGDADVFSYDPIQGQEVNLTPNSDFNRHPDVNLINGDLLVSSKRDGNGEIYRLRVGQSPLKLTHNPNDDSGARYSPDGQTIAFSSNRDGVYNVYIMDKNGQGIKRLTDFESGIQVNSWSSDGQFIYAEAGSWGSLNTYKIDVKTGEAEQLFTDKEQENFSVVSSPNMKYTAYTAGDKGRYNIMLKNNSTGDISQLTEEGRWNFSPAFSPNGKKIAYASNQDGDLEIYTMKIDGSEKQQLTDNYRDDEYPRWSADGNTVYFDSNRTGNFQTFSVKADGSERKQLTHMAKK